MNILDIFIIVVILVTFLWGFKAGLIRQLLGVAALYIGIVIAVLGYESLGNAMKAMSPNFTIDASYAIAFLLITLVVTAILIGVTYAIYQHTSLSALGMFDQILGGVAGLLNGLLLLGMLMLVLHYGLLVDWGSANGTRDMLRIAQESSFLKPILTQVSDFVVALVQPWNSNRTPVILDH